MADENKIGPDGPVEKIDQRSADNTAMSKYWEKVDDLIEGVDAVKQAGQTYLPKFPHEDQKDYDFRLSCATMTNVYRDVVEGLATKPFGEEAGLSKDDNVPEEFKKLADNIDGSGNNLHVFLAEVFFYGINNVIDWVLVDYPTVDLNQVRTIEQEKQIGARPYWVRVPGSNVLDVRTKKIGGIEKIVYIKIFEPNTTDGDQIRVFDGREGSVVYRIYRKNDKKEWYLAVEDKPITIDEIPMVPFYTGRRKGTSWKFSPALRDAADLQVELYQRETGLKHIENLTCYPMLAGNGVTPAKGPDGKPLPVPMGPGAVLFAPPNDNGSSGAWERIAADAQSLDFLLKHIDSIKQQIRELGKNPLTAQSGNITRISAAFAASKGNSAAQKWVLNLKDAAEQAMKFTAKWMKQSIEPEIYISTDFAIESDENTAPDKILDLRKNGDLSQKTTWAEMKRHGVLSSDFDPDKEEQALALEYPDDSIVRSAISDNNDIAGNEDEDLTAV